MNAFMSFTIASFRYTLFPLALLDFSVEDGEGFDLPSAVAASIDQ